MTIEEQILQTLLVLPLEQRVEVRDFAEFLRMRRQSTGQQLETPGRHHDLDEIFGAWSAEEYEQIEGSLQDQRKVDPELWV